MNKETSLARAQNLKKNEELIESARQSFYIKAGTALLLIRDQELWREGDYKDFDDYCQKRWGWTRKRADQLILATNVVKSLPTSVGKQVDNEAAARALAKVPADQRQEVVEQAAKEGEVTAPAVEKAARAAAKPKDDKVCDAVGNELKWEARKFWDRKDQFSDVVTEARSFRTWLRQTMDQRDPIWHEVNFSLLEARVDEVISIIDGARPYAVCTECYGAPSTRGGKCGFCGNRGLISKMRWDVMVAQEKKAILLKDKRKGDK